VKEFGAIQIIMCTLVYYQALRAHVLYVESCVLYPLPPKYVNIINLKERRQTMKEQYQLL